MSTTITAITLINAGFEKTNRGNFDLSTVDHQKKVKIYKRLKLIQLTNFINGRKESHKKAVNIVYPYSLSETIFLGASKNRYGYDVYTEQVVTVKESKLFLKEVKKIELANEKAKKIPLTSEQKAKKLKLQIENKEFKTKMEKTILECYLKFDKYSKMLYLELDDIREADTSWLDTAYTALVYSSENGGIMANYKAKLRQDEELCFYDLLRKAINAYRRHADTDYDHLLASGMSREGARDVIYNR